MVSQAEDVKSWVTLKGKELEGLCALYEGLSPKTRKELFALFGKEKDKPAVEPYFRLFTAMEVFGPKKTKELYKSLLEEAALDWRLAEQIAEDIVDVIKNAPGYQKALERKKEYGDERAIRDGQVSELRQQLSSDISAKVRKQIMNRINQLEESNARGDKWKRKLLDHFFVGEFLKHFGDN